MSRPAEQTERDSLSLRRALGAFGTGVCIVTTHATAHGDRGVTINSFASVSLEPPLVLWSLANAADCMLGFGVADHFAVHVLAADQQALSMRFAEPGADRFAGLSIARGVGEVPLIEGCCARFECRIVARHPGGDHQIIVGEVLRHADWPREPLLYHRGGYARLG